MNRAKMTIQFGCWPKQLFFLCLLFLWLLTLRVIFSLSFIYCLFHTVYCFHTFKFLPFTEACVKSTWITFLRKGSPRKISACHIGHQLLIKNCLHYQMYIFDMLIRIMLYGFMLLTVTEQTFFHPNEYLWTTVKRCTCSFKCVFFLLMERKDWCGKSPLCFDKTLYILGSICCSHSPVWRRVRIPPP
jgi:hypothetical protein